MDMQNMTDEKLLLCGPPAPYEPVKGGIGYELFRVMKLREDLIAEHYIESGESCTYGDILVRSRRLALHFLTEKLNKDDMICLCSHNQMNCVVPFYAAKFIDVSYASLEPSMSEEDLKYLFHYVKPKVLVIAEDVEEKIEKCLEETDIKCSIIVIGKSEKYVTLDKIIQSAHPDEENFAPVFIDDLKETAVIFFSSGTTGKPKGICCNHYSLLAQLVNMSFLTTNAGKTNLSNFSYKLNESNDEETQGNFLMYSPMYWISGIAGSLMTLINGNRRTVGAFFKSDTAWKAIEKYKPTRIFLPPGQVVDLYLKRDKINPNHSIQMFMTGGGPVKPMHLKYISEMFPNAIAVQIYGMTETCGLVSGFSLRDPHQIELQKKYPESCGLITYGNIVKVVDVDTERLCKVNEQGELRIKTKYIMNGYYKVDSSSSFDADGFFKTGDLVYVNEDKCLTIVDRIKDILLYTLYNIRPSVIENILAQHPSIYESFIIGIPHPEDNERPMGVVVLKDEYKNKITSEELVEYVNERVPSDRYKIRAGIKFVDEMIKTPSGKIRKIAMKNLFLEGKL